MRKTLLTSWDSLWRSWGNDERLQAILWTPVHRGYNA